MSRQTLGRVLVTREVPLQPPDYPRGEVGSAERALPHASTQHEPRDQRIVRVDNE
jgi:hypothetical protein